MKSYHKRILLILIFIFSLSIFTFPSQRKNKAIIQTAYASLYKKRNVFSKVIKVLKEGNTVQIIKSNYSYWLKVKIGSKSGYILKKQVIFSLQPVNENIYNILVKNKNDKNIDASKKGFSEEEELGASVKGFSEEEELGASVKGFSEEEELGASVKGFSKKQKDAITGSKEGRLKIIFDKFYTDEKGVFSKQQKRLFKKIKKYKAKKRRTRKKTRTRKKIK